MWLDHRHEVFLIFMAFFVHILILQGVFDIYFSSPIDNGMTPVLSTRNPPANRIVLIVSDGLRAESILGQLDVAPNLNEIKNTRGSWGISHTRVPTESRPGHVGLLAGIYEDPSALLKGWKVNPVDFDSVINQSRNAWCWGAPSIIKMFNKDNLPHIHLHSYGSELEDFGNNNTIGLDLWVFEHVQAFINEQIRCVDCHEFRENGNLFFLHLLGMDTVGHGFKPGSSEYKANLKFVDSYIPKIETWFETAFPDRRTAYIFTSDHGMTNWGSHGSGSDHETTTPFIAWGSGIKQDYVKKDLQQIDVAPLLSALIGINYPLNSLGQLPSQYILCYVKVLCEMKISNLLQIMEIFNVKMNRIMNNTLVFEPFKGVTAKEIQAEIDSLKHLAAIEDYPSFFEEADNFAKFLIEGADYYHNYYQLPILISISIGIIGWILYLATYTIELQYNDREILSTTDWTVFLPMYCSAILIVIVQKLPQTYYLYFLFPIIMAQLAVRNCKYYIVGLKRMKRYGIGESLKYLAIYGAGLKFLADGFKNKEYFSVVMFLMGAVVIVFDTCSLTPMRLKIRWFCFCLFMAVFPMLPDMTVSFNLYTYLAGYILWWFVPKKIMKRSLRRHKILKIQHLMLKVTPLYTLAVHYGVISSESKLKYFAAFWSAVSILLILFVQDHVNQKNTSIFIGFGTFYLMVTTNYENIFMVGYVLLLFTWIKFEVKYFGIIIERNFYGEIINHVNINRGAAGDYRRAFFFVVFIFIGFFGTGNIASLNSFDPMWVRCFLTVFSPFKMSAIILLRVMVPFIFASCVYRTINIILRSNTLNIFCIVLMYSDLMLLNFLYSIKNIGSWLEIGMSLSEFIIMEVFVLSLLMLYELAYVLVMTTLRF